MSTLYYRPVLLTYLLTDRQTDRQIKGQTEGQVDRMTEGQAGRQRLYSTQKYLPSDVSS